MLMRDKNHVYCRTILPTCCSIYMLTCTHTHIVLVLLNRIVLSWESGLTRAALHCPLVQLVNEAEEWRDIRLNLATARVSTAEHAG